QEQLRIRVQLAADSPLPGTAAPLELCCIQRGNGNDVFFEWGHQGDAEYWFLVDEALRAPLEVILRLHVLIAIGERTMQHATALPALTVAAPPPLAPPATPPAAAPVPAPPTAPPAAAPPPHSSPAGPPAAAPVPASP
ncbi:hypothetical protein DUNSADRAFT_4390, partial [Dunaliella salina]